MSRWIDVGIYLRPGIPDEPFVAGALGNLAALELERERGETLEWQVLRVEGSRPHHYRLVVRHPARALDLGLRGNLGRVLDQLSAESSEELRARLRTAVAAGAKPVALRTVRDEVDFWQDDFWTFLGGPMGFGPI